MDIERLTHSSYEEWKRQLWRGYYWRIRKQQDDKNDMKRGIKRLREDIKQKRFELKHTLRPEKPDTSLSAYARSVKSAEKEAKERQWTWVPPENSARIRKRLERLM